MDLLGNIEEVVKQIIEVLGIIGPLTGCLFILVESMIPILPLAVFITLNFLVFGNLLGFIISWIFTVSGCMIAFHIFKKGFNIRFNKYISNKERTTKLMEKVSQMTMSEIVVLLAIPFTPAFLINILAGLSDISYKKYLISLLIGKISLVYFWGYIGVSLLESIKNPMILIRISILVLTMYLISKIVNKKLNV